MLDYDSLSFPSQFAVNDMIERREMLNRLAYGNRVLFPERARAIVERLVDPGFVAVHQEALVLARALAPEFFDSYLRQLKIRLADPQHVDILKRVWDAELLDPDDPQIEVLVDALVDSLLTHRELLVMPQGFDARPDAAVRYNLLNHHREDEYPTSAQLTELIDAKLRTAGFAVPARQSGS